MRRVGTCYDQRMAVDPLRDLRAWQDRLERLASQHTTSWAPPIDIYETADQYVITAEVPGLTREQIDVAAEDNRITLRGARPGAAGDGRNRHYHQVERGYGSFTRSFEFADPIETDKISADLQDGVLTVTLPKMPTPPVRRIEVQ
jgi:HSP20 family protein